MLEENPSVIGYLDEVYSEVFCPKCRSRLDKDGSFKPLYINVDLKCSQCLSYLVR